MSQQDLPKEANGTVTASSAVEEACGWVRWLVQHESRGNGDKKNAMRRLACRYPGLSKTLILNLSYRSPKDMLLSSYLGVRAAYLAECERHERALRLQREKTEATTFLGAALLRSADRLAGQNDQDLNQNPRR